MDILSHTFEAEDAGGAARDIRPYVMKLLRPWDNTVGVDVGCSQHKVLASAIGVDTYRGAHAADGEPNSLTAGRESVNLVGNGLCLEWFRDGVLDYVFSSHMLEHIPQSTAVLALAEWYRVLKPGGLCIIYLPDGEVREFPEYHLWHPRPADILQRALMFPTHRLWVPRKELAPEQCVRSLAWSFLVVLQK
jgi:SAM-dependent methyltransferase